MKKNLLDRRDFFVIFLCMLLTTSLGVFLIGNKGFAMDELATVFFTRDWSALVHSITFEEGNMWLYYFLLFLWQFFGHSESILRLFSVLFAAGTVPFVYGIGKEFFSKQVAIIASILFSVHIFLLSNAQNARSYTMVLFFTTASSYCFLKYMLQGSKRYVFLSAFANLLAVYSHLYGLFIIGAQFLSVILFSIQGTRRFKEKNNYPLKLYHKLVYIVVVYTITFILTFVFLFPLFLAPSLHSGQIDWIAKPTIRNLIGTFLILSGDYPAIGGLYLLLFGWFSLTLWQKRTHWEIDGRLWKYEFLLLWIFIPIVVSFLFSLFVKPIYISAYFFVCLVPFILLVAYCVNAVKNQWLKISFIAIVILLSVVRLYGWYTGSKTIGLVIRNYTEDFKGTAEFLVAHTAKTDGIIIYPSHAQDNVNFYIPEHMHRILSYEINPQTQSVPSSYSRIWYVLETVTDSKVDSANRIITGNLLKQYRLHYVYKLDAITISEYEIL